MFFLPYIVVHEFIPQKVTNQLFFVYSMESHMLLCVFSKRKDSKCKLMLLLTDLFCIPYVHAYRYFIILLDSHP